jgi:aspartate-semialdehyde dehydrogenase
MISVGILGATGIVGQQYIQQLLHHPYFKITFLAASPDSAGKTYEEATRGRWHLSETCPDAIKNTRVHSIEEIAIAKQSCQLVFSAISSEAACQYEERYAQAGLIVVSNASYHRNTADVPLLIPEVNSHHLTIIPMQQKNRGWTKGFIVVKPNCSLQSYLIPLYPLHKAFKIKQVIVNTLQAVSGAGYPGVSSLTIADNVIPFIANEEEKTEREPLKILGSVHSNGILEAQGIAISAHCHRVPVLDGHLASVSVSFEKQVTKDEILSLWDSFPGLSLPSAPRRPIIYRHEEDRPQPRLDRLADKGMAVTVGRLRPCHVFDFRFTALSHNTIRGAAGGGILNAELLVAKKFVDSL